MRITPLFPSRARPLRKLPGDGNHSISATSVSPCKNQSRPTGQAVNAAKEASVPIITMTRSVETPIAVPSPATPAPAPPKRWCALLALLFGGRPASDSVQTKLHIAASPEAIWKQILFYEEISATPPLLLRALIRRPLHTSGDKTTPGSIILCTYQRGHLLKRITALEPSRLIEFEVVTQKLGIETCVTAKSGSYRIGHTLRGAEVVLTTNYQSHLHPRPLFRPLERLAIHQLHRHILNGMRQAVATPAALPFAFPAECPVPVSVSHPNNSYRGAKVCTISHSPSRR